MAKMTKWTKSMITEPCKVNITSKLSKAKIIFELCKVYVVSKTL